MDPKLHDRLPIIIVFIIGIILVVDLVNVFFIGGPSLFSLIFKSGNAASGTPQDGILAKNSSINEVPEGTSSSPAIFVPTTATPVPVVSYIEVVTPIESADDHPTYRTFAAPTMTQQDDTYAFIYSGNLSYYHGEAPTAVAFDVKEPPLMIKYQVIPMITDDHVLVKNQTASAKKAGTIDEVVNTTYASPLAVFTVTVYDRNSGGKISQDGFGTEYGTCTEKTIVVRDAGKYIIQFDGEYVEAHVDMQLKREGNLV
ncbi:MAG: hypothetical protein M0R30_03325 [Methanoregula sp.]|jgi:hypothetical protein|uniref:hypothetical protein n=1 Tax=Methanoregula sp. TaxID=2052170 RepID=UPI0025EA0443|nr:hypothetical protein [Methanoregula sp.]MCK9630651.1 hypothetical protein [Methanoregula sp.]